MTSTTPLSRSTHTIGEVVLTVQHDGKTLALPFMGAGGKNTFINPFDIVGKSPTDFNFGQHGSREWSSTSRDILVIYGSEKEDKMVPFEPIMKETTEEAKRQGMTIIVTSEGVKVPDEHNPGTDQPYGRKRTTQAALARGGFCYDVSKQRFGEFMDVWYVMTESGISSPDPEENPHDFSISVIFSTRTGLWFAFETCGAYVPPRLMELALEHGYNEQPDDDINNRSGKKTVGNQINDVFNLGGGAKWIEWVSTSPREEYPKQAIDQLHTEWCDHIKNVFEGYNTNLRSLEV